MAERNAQTVESGAEGDRLVSLARRALEAHVRGEPRPPRPPGSVRAASTGAFVSIHTAGGDLRGCLGRLQPSGPLVDTVVELAAAVADSDPRFVPVRPHELASLHVEVSVLGPEREVGGPAHVEVGRHGVIVEYGAARGLLLPQVAIEYRWDSRTFVEQACVKAGLPRHAWQQGARIYVFEAEVFSESSRVRGGRHP